jgi:lipoprotein-anchoring transpeptidase ErfK/SrfK
MNWDELYRQVAVLLHGNPALADERPFLYVDSSTQQIHRIDMDENENCCYPVSTSIHGLGNRSDSQKTPTGVHRIREKIGGGQPAGMIFKSREATGNIFDQFDIGEDDITSRILRLDGMEAGVNKDGVHDSYDRYIYIHGTSDEKRIGHPASIGCIRMNNADIIELFDEVLVNDLVIIR